ncbi:phage head morphogenesis protein, partial [Streptomyces sp. SID10244]|nr:phage head morphogenesis protein [Streptomyces sp. SID10244]
EMIAQTESVNAWSKGQYEYAKAAGAKKKVWEALAGACPQCAPMDGEKVEIDEPFSGGVLLPSRHPRCRCSVYFEY